MGKMMGKSTSLVQNTVSGFEFSGVDADHLKENAMEYTLATVLLDLSGSVNGWEPKLEECIQMIVKCCRKCPRADNLLLRLVTFNSNTSEVHGFVKLMDINPADYKGKFYANGQTALNDALLNAIESTSDYGVELDEKANIFSNAVIYCITDGDENASVLSSVGCGNSDPKEFAQKKIAKAIDKIRKDEIIESVKVVLIGIADPKTQRGQEVIPMLEQLKKNANIDEFYAVGDLSAGTLAKISGFVSHSTSSSSQALYTGGPSKPIDPNSVTPVDLNSI